MNSYMTSVSLSDLYDPKIIFSVVLSVLDCAHHPKTVHYLFSGTVFIRQIIFFQFKVIKPGRF